MRYGFFILAFLLGSTLVSGQSEERVLPLRVGVFNNATLLPGSGEFGIWGVPVHPGISVGTEFLYYRHSGHDWFQTVRFDYFFHRFLQHGLILASDIGYRKRFAGGNLDIESRLGLGYMHSISAAAIFKLNGEGVYERQHSLGKPQLNAGLSLGLGYRLGGELPVPVRVFLSYGFYIQAPFVQEYVPVLPNTHLQLGVSFPFFSIKK